MTTQSNRRAEEEIARFTEKYPDTDLDSVPESVWNRVKEGADLSEAYGAHRKKLREEEAEAARINEKTAAESSGRISGRPKRAVYTAADVFAMSASEVRDNYEDIILSMEQNGFYQD